MSNYVVGKYFFGNEISEYGQKNNRVDYATLAKSFDAVISNDLMEKTADIGYWELENGDLTYYYHQGKRYTEEELEVYQWYIISDNGASILKDWTNEIVYYNDELDLYLWGVTHYGTSWDYVLTDIKCNVN